MLALALTLSEAAAGRKEGGRDLARCLIVTAEAHMTEDFESDSSPHTSASNHTTGTEGAVCTLGTGSDSAREQAVPSAGSRDMSIVASSLERAIDLLAAEGARAEEGEAHRLLGNFHMKIFMGGVLCLSCCFTRVVGGLTTTILRILSHVQRSGALNPLLRSCKMQCQLVMTVIVPLR